MTISEFPFRLLVLDIDGLRQDVFHQALEAGRIPNLAGLLGGPDASLGMHIDPCSTAPSITFCAQTTIFTGGAPRETGIAGNQFFDRLGRTNGGKPRFYAFDMGDALAVKDAVTTFTGEIGLLGETIHSGTPTLYEKAAGRGRESVVSYHMVSRGAGEWIRPSLVDIARFTKGGGLVGMSAEQYDTEMVDRLLAYLRGGAHPAVITAYFMGLDHQSHEHGPGVQVDYLAGVVDRQVGRLVDELRRLDMLEGTLALAVSDHGHIGVIPDDRHSLRLSFPFDREMAYLFDALGLDVNDVPGEGADSSAVVASNGGLAHVYLQHGSGRWQAYPRFEQDVLPVGRAFWQANLTGQYAPDLHGALAMVLARSAEQGGWAAPYQALTAEGALVPVDAYLAQHPEIQTVDAAPRLRALAGENSGDLILVSNYADGFYFGGITTGVHGGLHPDDSLAVASLGWTGASAGQVSRLRETAVNILEQRRASEGRSRASLQDLVPILTTVMGYS